MSANSLNGLLTIQPNTLNGLLDIYASNIYIDGIPVVPGGFIDTAVPPLVITGINNNIIECPNLTISTNTPATTYNDYQGYLAGGSGTGNFNVCMGRRTGKSFTTAQNNSLIGYTTGDRLTSGSNNIMVNCNAVIDTGNDNVILGNNSTSLMSLSNVKVIGNSNLVNHNDCNVIGDAITTSIPNSSYMNNIRNITTNNNNLTYNILTKEITYEAKPPVIPVPTSTVITTSSTYNFSVSDLYNYFVFTSNAFFSGVLPNPTGLPTGAWISICKAGSGGSITVQQFGGGIYTTVIPNAPSLTGNAIRFVLSSDGNFYSG